MAKQELEQVSDEELANFQQLISKSRYILPIPQSLPTLLEISGYPHFENVISNILQFFFDSNEDHELSSIFIKSLLSAADNLEEFEFQNFETVNVKREDTTNTNNRIDLVIETDSFCIAIENKINAPLDYNDLDNYQSYIDDSYIENNYSELRTIFVVLALDDYTGSSHLSANKFRAVTYDNFLTELESRLGRAVVNTHPKLLIYLTDLIKTLRNMNKPTQLNMKFIEFLEKNKKEIESLYKYSFKTFKKEIKSKAEEIANFTSEKNHGFEKFHLTKPNHLEYVQGYKKWIESKGFEVQIKLRISPSGYSLEIWEDSESDLKKFDRYVSRKLDKEISELNKYGQEEKDVEINEFGIVIDEFDYSYDCTKIRNELLNTLSKF